MRAAKGDASAAVTLDGRASTHTHHSVTDGHLHLPHHAYAYAYAYAYAHATATKATLSNKLATTHSTQFAHLAWIVQPHMYQHRHPDLWAQ